MEENKENEFCKENFIVSSTMHLIDKMRFKKFVENDLNGYMYINVNYIFKKDQRI